MTEIIYLASPYSHTDPNVTHRRFQAAAKAAAKLMREGYIVFSPIAHSHPVSHFLGNGLDHDFWLRQDLEFLKIAKKVVVLMLPGWQESRGVGAEVRIAGELGIPVEYMEP